MRADRLVAILMLLQTRGQVTAAQVAEELEVSERTARRDLEALGVAGVPIYSKPGRNGGWQLVGGARTDLSGLTADESRALFLVAGPASAATPAVKAALRKLMRALPEPFRADADAASRAVVFDSTRWGSRAPERPPPVHLDGLQRAVIEGDQIELEYVARDGARTSRAVHPLGLAAKGSVWYLVADTERGLRSFRCDRVNTFTRIGAPVVRPPDFDLEAAWRSISESLDVNWMTLYAHGFVRPDHVAVLRYEFQNRLKIGPARSDGWVEVEVGGADPHVLAAELAGFGAALEIHAPASVRVALWAIGRALIDRYDGATMETDHVGGGPEDGDA